jgi:hypothetical protein
VRAQVLPGGLIFVERVRYSVPIRLRGRQVRVRANWDEGATLNISNLSLSAGNNADSGILYIEIGVWDDDGDDQKELIGLHSRTIFLGDLLESQGVPGADFAGGPGKSDSIVESAGARPDGAAIRQDEERRAPGNLVPKELRQRARFHGRFGVHGISGRTA